MLTLRDVFNQLKHLEEEKQSAKVEAKMAVQL